MFDKPKDTAISRLLEVPDLSLFVLEDEEYSEAMKTEEDEFHDHDLIVEIRRNILVEKEETVKKDKDEQTGEKEKDIKRKKPRRLYFLRLILKMLFGYKEFMRPVIFTPLEEEEETESFHGAKIKQIEPTRVEIESFRARESLEELEEKKKVVEKKKEGNPFARFSKKFGFDKNLNKIHKKFLTSNYLIGLDIGTHSVKYVFIKKDKDILVLEKYSIQEIPAMASEEDINKKLLYSINKIVKEEEVNISEVVVNFSKIPTETKIIQIPKLKKKEAHDAILWKVKKELPEDYNDAVIRYQFTDSIEEKNVDKKNVLVFIVHKRDIDINLKFLRDMGIIPTKVTFTPLSIFSYLKYYYPQESDEGSIVIDLGGYKTLIMIIERGLIKIVREINIGGEDFTKALEGKIDVKGKTMEINYDSAKKLKFDYGISSRRSVGNTNIGIPISEVGHLMEPLVEKLAGEIKTSIDFFTKSYPEAKINTVFLTGGGSKLINLKEVLSEKTSYNIKNFETISNLKPSDTIIDGDKLFRDSYLLSNSLGLVVENLNTFNFLSENFRAARGKNLFSLVSGFVGLLLLIVLSVMSIRIAGNARNIEAELDKIKVEFTALSPIQKDYNDLISQKNRIETMHQDLEKELILIEGKYTSQNIMKIISNMVPEDIALISLSYEGDFLKDGERKLNIEGKYSGAKEFGDNIIINFVLKIENSGFFKKVIMEKTPVEDSGEANSFKVICTI